MTIIEAVAWQRVTSCASNGCCFSLIEQIVSCWHRLIFHRNLQPTTNLPSPPPASLLVLPLPFPFYCTSHLGDGGEGDLGFQFIYLLLIAQSIHCYYCISSCCQHVICAITGLGACSSGHCRAWCVTHQDAPTTNIDLLVAARSRQPPSVASTIISFLTTT